MGCEHEKNLILMHGGGRLGFLRKVFGIEIPHASSLDPARFGPDL